MAHTFVSHPVQPCGNKADALFSPYVLLKRALFDLKLIGQAWAQGLKAWTAGLSTAARVVVEVGEESLSLSHSLSLPFPPSLNPAYFSYSFDHPQCSVRPSLPLSMLCCSRVLPLSIC